MSGAEILDITREAVRVAFVISLPVLAVALLTGLLIGLFQALTSIQELTLTFVPKLAAIAAAYWISMGFMAGEVVDLFQNRLIPLIAGM